MATKTQVPEITKKQENYIGVLAAQRPGWINTVTGADFETVTDTLVNLQIKQEAQAGGYASGGLKKIALKDASRAIDALLKIKPTPLAVPKPQPAPVADPARPTPLERLQTLLAVIPTSKSVKFAVEVDGVLKFYAIDLRKTKAGHAVRYVRQLLGAPGSWNRKILSVTEQLTVARLIAQNWEAAAHAYADKHGRCARCDAHLSDERSRAAKAGWKCAKEWGWAW